MDDFLRQVSGTISRWQMLQPGDSVLAAVSGGADSVCLVLALKELGYRVHALHVEHGIRGQESLEDCAFVRKLCEKHEIPLTVEQIDAPALAARSGRSVEEAARDARYRIIREILKRLKIRHAAVAHHRDDQAETVLWNLMRGSSLTGLCGILPVRRMEETGLCLIRPLLETGREEIEAWLTGRGQSWRTDRTNLDTNITRNAIRLEILPQMEELNARARLHIAKTAEDLAQVERYLEDVTRLAYTEAVSAVPADPGAEPAERGGLTVDLQVLARQPELIRGRVLHRAIGQAGGGLRDITREHVESVMRLSGMDNGRRISLPGGLTAVREEGILRLTYESPSSYEEEVRIDRDGVYRFPGGLVLRAEFGVWQGGDVSKKKYTKTLAYDTMTPYLTLRTRREGDWIQVNSHGGRRKLKEYLIDEKIPRDRRGQIPLIAQGSHVLWVIGHRISEAAKVSEGVHFARITVLPEEEVKGRETADRRDL